MVHTHKRNPQSNLKDRVLENEARSRLVANIASHMSGINPDIQRRQIQHFLKADPEYGNGVAKLLQLKVDATTV